VHRNGTLPLTVSGGNTLWLLLPASIYRICRNELWAGAWSQDSDSGWIGRIRTHCYTHNGMVRTSGLRGCPGRLWAWRRELHGGLLGSAVVGPGRPQLLSDSPSGGEGVITQSGGRGRLPTQRMLADRYLPPNGGQFGLFVPSVQDCAEPWECPEFPAWGIVGRSYHGYRGGSH
jgi:hypothetical protein